MSCAVPYLLHALFNVLLRALPAQLLSRQVAEQSIDQEERRSGFAGKNQMACRTIKCASSLLG